MPAGKKSLSILPKRQNTIDHIKRLQPLAYPKREILPPGPPSKRETNKMMGNVRKAHITSAKREVPCGRGPGGIISKPTQTQLPW